MAEGVPFHGHGVNLSRFGRGAGDAGFLALLAAFAFDDEFIGRRLQSVAINNPSLKNQIEIIGWYVISTELGAQGSIPRR